MDQDGARWIEELPAGLAAQQSLLRGLLAFSQADPDVKWLVVGCSLARGAFLGWCALADLGKYVRRGSGWEALERLHEARAQLWQLWAAVRGVPQPQYGLTSVLDYAAVLPEGIEETVSGLDVGSLLAAGLRVAELLGEVGGQLGEEQRAALPSAMGPFVLSDLRAAVTG